MGIGSSSNSKKDAIANTAAEAVKVSAGIAKAALLAVGPILVSQGKEAAKAALLKKMPGAAPYAGPLVDAFADQVQAQVIEGGFDGAFDEDYAYVGALDECVASSNITGGFEGGCGCKWGANELNVDTVREYSDSINSKAKSKIIADILDACSRLGMKITGDSQQDKIKSLLAQLPSGDKFKVSDEAHRKVCMGIAEAINRAHGSEVINKSLDPEVVCQQVAEITSSLAVGMHSEFLAVYEDVRRTLKNLHVVKDTLNEVYANVLQRIKSSEDPTLMQQLSNYDEVFKLLLAEDERQIELLSNLLNISLAPAEKDLASLLRSKKDLHGFIEKLDIKVGSDKFGKVISDVLKGLGITANLALMVERALKTAGITLDEYMKMNSQTELLDKIHDKIKALNLAPEELHKVLESIELLVKYFPRKEDIVAALQKTGHSEMDISGGADYPKTVMDKRVADRNRLRKIIFTTFYRQINENFDKLIGTLDTISMKVGSEIPLSDQLDSFRHILQRIDESLVRNKNIYYALIGYYNDAMSRSKRDSLLADLKMVNSYIDTIVEMSLYAQSKQYFTAVQAQIKSIVDLIDRYSDEIAQKFGRGEESDPISGGFENPDAIYGGADSLDKLEPQLKYKSTKSIHDAVRQFDYKYRVAQIRSNMNATGKELQHYSEKYEKIIANSIADILSDDKKKFETLRKQLDDTAFGADSGYAVAGTEIANEADVKAQRQAAVRFLESQWDVKKRFWATIEAADTYMRVFTDALVKNPGDIKEIKSMLDEIEVINDWYTDKTGNDLAGVFDYFPGNMRGASLSVAGNAAARELLYPVDSYTNKASSSSHYYERIKKQLTDAPADPVSARPGNPYLVASPVRGEQARAQTKRMLSGLGVLKNLLSVFVNVGSKFGGEELRKKVFMSPAQMYNNIVDYIQASAFAQGFGVGEGTDDKLPEHWLDSDDAAVNVDQNSGTATAVANGTTYFDDGTVNLGVVTHALPVIANPAADNTQRQFLFKKRWGVWMRSIVDGLKAREGFGFKREDEYFVLMMKSLAAKILTVTGMYDVLDRPMEYNGLSPIRMITGGAVETPKVTKEATPLYLRLTLLAQFYKNLFNFEGDENYKEYSQWRGNDKNIKISMAYDIDGMFAGLIRKVFRDNKSISANSYSDDDIKELVREINLIHQRVQGKNPKDATTEAIHEFIAEINRRYGVVSRSDRESYDREFGYKYDYSKLNTIDRYNEAPEVDEIALLPGEGDDEISRPSAAQRLLGESLETSTEKKRLYTITSQHKDLVYRFRCAIDKYFENPNEELTFNHAIKAAQMKLDREQNDEARFKIIASLIRGVDIYSKVDGMKYVLFHETVVGGLNMLSAVHTMLARFKRRAHIIDLKGIEDQIWEYLKIVGAKDLNGIAGHVINYLTNTLRLANTDDARISQLVDKLFGRFEARVFNGGSTMADSEYIIKRGNGNNNDVDRDSSVDINSIVVQPGAARWRGKDNQHGLTTGPDGNADPKGNNPNGLFSVLLGFTVEELQAAYRAPLTPKNRDAKLAAETFMRFIFGREHVMKELLETIFGLSSDFQGLVDIKIEDGKLYMNYGGLKTLVEDMFQHVGYFLDILRPHIKEDVILRYTDKQRPGSYYWLQEQLLEKIIVGRPSATSVLPGETAPRIGYVSLDELMQKLTTTYELLTREWNVDGAGLRAAALSTVSAVKSRNHFDKVFAEMVFYDASKPGSGLIHSEESGNDVGNNGEALGGLKIVDYMHNQYEALHFFGPMGGKALDTRYIARFYQLYSWKNEFTLNRSALFAFNQLIAKYIQNFYDPVSGKIYAGMLNQFANGAFSRAIADQKFTYPDTAPMWFVKNAVSSDMKLPSSINLTPLIADTQSAQVSALSEIVDQYLEYGIGPNKKGSPDNSRLLYFGNPALTATTAVNGVNIPHITLWLLGHIIAKVAFNALQRLNAGGALQANDLPLFTAINGAAFANLAAVNTAFPNLQSIINALFAGTDPAKLARIEGIATLNAQSAITGVALIAVDTANAQRVLDAHNQILRLPSLAGAAAANWGNVAIAACKLFPYTDNAIGNSDSDRKYRAEIFALISAAVASAQLATQGIATQADADADLKDSLDKIRNAVTSIKSVYVNPSNAQAHMLAKYDDLMLTSDKFADAVPGSTPDANYLLLARDEQIGNYLPAGNIKQLGSSPVANTAADTIANITNFGQRWDPDGEHVLFTSLAVIMKNLLTSRNAQTQSLVYIQDNVADIPLYMKERMRANLPAFRGLFKELIARCEFLKKMMNRPEMSLERNYVDIPNVNVPPTRNPWPYVLLAPTQSSADTKSRFTSVCDSIVRGCTALISSCEQVLREIGDDPKYFELYQNSIKDYKAQYGFDPLMPLSSTLAVLKNVDNGNYLDFFPVHALGEDQFKFMYGVRSLINQPAAQPLMEHAVGFAQIVDSFNLTIDTKLAADRGRADAFLKTFTKMLRYVHELKHVKGLLTPYVLIDTDNADYPNLPTINRNLLHVSGSFVRDELVLTNKRYANSGDRDATVARGGHIYHNGFVDLTNKSDVSLVADGDVRKPPYPLPVYAISKSLSDTIKLTESSFRDDKIKELVEYLNESSKKTNSLEIQNIIDLNIVPINVHALMREIPLVNLYNYAYTFDRLIIELYYGLKNDNARKLITELCDPDAASRLKRITSAKDMLVALLLNPYTELFKTENAATDNLYESFAKSMLVGVPNNGELGRPKFLSDQVFNKAVFGEMYAKTRDYNEMGPAAGHIANVKISKETALNVYSKLIVITMGMLNGGARFQNMLLQVNNDNILRLIVPIASYVNDNPRVDLTTLSNMIHDKFLDNTVGKGVNAFKNLRAIADANCSRRVSTALGFVAKLLHYPVAALVSKLNKTGDNNHIAQASHQLDACMNIITRFGNSNAHSIEVPDPFGVTTANTSISLKAEIDANVNVNSEFKRVMQGVIDDIIIETPVPGNNGNGSAVPDVNNVRQLLGTLLRGTNVDMPSLSGKIDDDMVDNSSLHWLDINPIHDDNNRYEDDGVGIQGKPAGDNANVLDPNQVKSVAIPADLRNVLAVVGRLRFDTVLIRNLVFIVNLYRSVRMKLQRDLTYNKDVITRSAPITRVQLTEFYGNQVDHEKQSYKQGSMWARYNY